MKCKNCACMIEVDDELKNVYRKKAKVLAVVAKGFTTPAASLLDYCSSSGYSGGGGGGGFVSTSASLPIPSRSGWHCQAISIM